MNTGNDCTELTTVHTITDRQIRTLQSEAGAAGDTDMVSVCRVAMGDEETATQTEIQAARRACADVISDAEAQS